MPVLASCKLAKGNGPASLLQWHWWFTIMVVLIWLFIIVWSSTIFSTIVYISAPARRRLLWVLCPFGCCGRLGMPDKCQSMACTRVRYLFWSCSTMIDIGICQLFLRFLELPFLECIISLLRSAVMTKLALKTEKTEFTIMGYNLFRSWMGL